MSFLNDEKLDLCDANLSSPFWKNKGFLLPKFDRASLRARTLKTPRCLHLGAGNIFRAFLAVIYQELIEQGDEDVGIIVAEGFDGEIVERAYRPFDDLSIFLRLNADKTMDKLVVGSVAQSFLMEGEDFYKLRQIAKAPSLQFISLTITEKAYQIKDSSGAFLSDIAADLEHGEILNLKSYLGKILSLLWARFQAGAHPIALLSLDNLVNNGLRLRQIIVEMAENLYRLEKVGIDFVEWIKSDALAFPCSMIDKITPRPSEDLSAMLSSEGVANMSVVCTQKGSFCAGFVNAESAQYLVIEDCFPNGRPALEKVGVIFTDRSTVDKVEKMKVGTCLNPLHTALAIFGMLFSMKSIAEAVSDPLLYRLLERLGYGEGLPVVDNPYVLDPKSFLDTVLKERFPNTFIPDTPARIACDTSQKLAIRFGKTIEAWGDDAHHLQAIPLIIAAWIRYLWGVDDNGNVIDLSPDPLLGDLRKMFVDLEPGVKTFPFLQKLLRDKTLFVVDLYAVGLGDKIERYFYEMMAGKGAVRATLRRYL